jgi:hypothetical protein
MNGEALEDRFGGVWPSFHDAEIYGLRIDTGQRRDGVSRLQLVVHVFDVDDGPRAGGSRFTTHTLVTFEFEHVEHVELEGFAPQNVLDGLHLERVDFGSGARFQVKLIANTGLQGGFRCRHAVVLEVVPFSTGRALRLPRAVSLRRSGAEVRMARAEQDRREPT